MTYRIAIAGCGNMSQAWISTALLREDCQIVALVDTNLDMARQRKEQYFLGCNAYTSLVAALDKEDVNLVFDITPPDHHFSTVTTPLKAGCNVFGEKPMADSLENAEKMVQCSDETKKEYFVMQNRRYVPEIRAMKSFLQSRKLGAIGHISANFQKNPHFGGFREEMQSPLIADMAIHHFDTARFLSGENAISVYCHEFNPAWSWYKGDASAVCIFEMSDGSVFDYKGSICANGFTTPWDSEWHALCADGGVYWDGATRLFYDVASGDLDKPTILSTGSVETNLIEPLPMEKTEHAGCISDMFEALGKGERPQTDCRDNINSIRMLYKAIESAKQKRAVLI